MKGMTREDLIETFGLELLTLEGGMFRLWYRNEEQIPAGATAARYGRSKATSNGIVYLHQPRTASFLHRLKTDELYHFYRGDPVEMALLYPDGHIETPVLGSDYEEGQKPFLCAPRGVWQGSRLKAGGAWALIGCTLAPAYDDDDFELGRRELLRAQYPGAEALIEALTPDDLDAWLATDTAKAGRIRLQSE